MEKRGKENLGCCWKKLVSFVKRQIILVLVLLVVLFPVLVWWAYPADGGAIRTQLSAGDILAYCGTVLAALASAYLAWVANKQNQRLIDLERERDMDEQRCVVVIDKRDCETKRRLSNEAAKSYTEGNTFSFCLVNCGPALLTKIIISFSVDEIFESHVTVCTGEEKNCGLCVPKNYTGGKANIEYVSCYEQSTYGEFEIKVDDETTKLWFQHYHYLHDKKP